MTAADLTNPRSTRVSRLARLASRSWRDKQRRFLVEGPQATIEALAAGAVEDLLVTPAALSRHPGLQAAGVRLTTCSDDVIAAVAQTVTPQGVVAVCRFLDVGLDEALRRRPRMAIVLDAARDPGNVGTVIRTADAAGAELVVLGAGSVDPYNGKCVRATTGSIFHLPIVTGVAAAAAVAALRDAGLQVFATDGAGPVDLDELADSGRLAAPTAWLIGNEAHGLPATTAAAADAVVAVPIHGRAESLNLGVAAAVCLYASARAQRVRPGLPAPVGPQ
ncbi:MAG: RNA methyltransferase [Actinomycetota bacterium]|nr:MAG: RNA methyltransferase [Actinomycetota bacterium]